MKRARIVTHTVEVCCPHCDAGQPAPDNGSFAWMPHQVTSEAEREPKRTCAECDEPFTLVATTTAKVEG